MAVDMEKWGPIVEKFLVYVICIAVLIFVGNELVDNVDATDALYKDVIAKVQGASDTSIVGRDRMTTAVAAIGMRDMSILRSAVLFVGFIVSLMGCVFVLNRVEALYKLRLGSGDKRASLSTASPGLVLITAGIVLVIVALRHESTVKLDLVGGATNLGPQAAQPVTATSGQAVQEERKVLDVSK